MTEFKKHVFLRGMAVLPVNVGNCAILFSDGRVIRTSRVVAIHEHTPEYLRFETLNTYYRVDMDPFPLAAADPLPVQMAA